MKHDIFLLVWVLVVQGAFSWLVPPRLWRHFASVFGALSTSLHPKRTGKNLSIITQFLEGQEDVPSALQAERGFCASRLEERFQYLRSFRPGGWHPVIRIHGTEHVVVAQTAGKGIIFWGGQVAFNDLISKIAFQRLGLEVYHYTRPGHGFSNSQFGIKFINPVRTLIELRYLAARVCAEENISKAMDVLKEYVEAGGSASIKTGQRGKKRVAVPFLNQQIELATGPVALAKRWNAALLPIFTLREQDGSFDVTIGPALESNESDLGAYCEEIVRKYSKQLEPYFLADPRQFRGWGLLFPKAS